MTEYNEVDYARYYGEDYETLLENLRYGCIIKVGSTNVFHSELANSAIEAWMQLLENGYDPVYIKPKEHD